MAGTNDALSTLLRVVDGARDEIATLLADLVRFPTVNFGDGHPGHGNVPNGNETPCAEYVRDWLRREGLVTDLHESVPTRGNVIARLPGHGRHAAAPPSDPSLLLMSHLDVVPVEDPDAWPHPPFAGTIADGLVYGRGSRDAKALTAASAMAAAILRRTGTALRGDLILLAAADEESGGRFGAGWIAGQPALAAQIRATGALNEGGGAAVRLPGNGVAYTWATGEKGRYEAHISVAGTSGHASAPWRAHNAIERVAEVVMRLRDASPRLDTSHATFRAVADAFGLPTITPANLETTIVRLGEAGRTAAGLLRGASRNTVVPTMVQAGVKSNSIPAACTLICDVRSLPGQDAAAVHRQIADILADLPWATVEVIETAVSNDSPWDHPLRDAAEIAIRRSCGRDDVTLMPALCAGFTDSRFARAIGVPTYDCAPGDWRDTSPDTGVHGTNERIPIDSLVAMTRFYVATAVTYLGGVGDSSKSS
jgi:acetylornithine deacetylase/succinyl-diaminopimelate desuccinylase-like protein